MQATPTATATPPRPLSREAYREILSRPYKLHCCRDGTITVRHDGEPIFNGVAVAVYGCATREDADDLVTLTCFEVPARHPGLPPGTPWMKINLVAGQPAGTFEIDDLDTITTYLYDADQVSQVRRAELAGAPFERTPEIEASLLRMDTVHLPRIRRRLTSPGTAHPMSRDTNHIDPGLDLLAARCRAAPDPAARLALRAEIGTILHARFAGHAEEIETRAADPDSAIDLAREIHQTHAALLALTGDGFRESSILRNIQAASRTADAFVVYHVVRQTVPDSKDLHDGAHQIEESLREAARLLSLGTEATR